MRVAKCSSLTQCLGVCGTAGFVLHAPVLPAALGSPEPPGLASLAQSYDPHLSHSFPALPEVGLS